MLMYRLLSPSQSLAEVLFPQLDTVCRYVQGLSESKDLVTRDTALRVHEALLVSLSHTHTHTHITCVPVTYMYQKVVPYTVSIHCRLHVRKNTAIDAGSKAIDLNNCTAIHHGVYMHTLCSYCLTNMCSVCKMYIASYFS